MAKLFFAFSFICNVLIIYASASAFSDILEDSTRCEGKCTKSYSPHTYPNGSDNEACMRGCRLYTITSIVTDGEPEHTNTIDDNGITPAKLKCHQSCVEAYNETSTTTLACKVGCDFQEQVSIEKKDEPKSEMEEGSVHLLKPVMQIREVVSKVVGMLRILQSSITTYFISDDNKLVAVEGPVEVHVQMIPEEFVSDSQEEESEEAKESESDGLVSSGAASIECLSRKVGVPPYLLIISLLGFIVFLAYILFVICSSSNKKKKVNSGLPIPASALPVKLVRPEDLTKLSLMDEEESQAPGLSPKMKLPNNTHI